MSDDSVAQLVEQLTLNQWVVGSSPTGVTKMNAKWLVMKPFGFFVVSTVGFLSLAKRHKIDDMAARTRCMETLRELFRQYMSLLILEKTKLEQHCIYLDPRISFNEIDRYFFSGCACAYFQIAVDVYTDLRYNADEWE